MNSILDATAVGFSLEWLQRADVFDELFDRFKQRLRAKWLEARGGQIIYAALLPVPKQRRTRAEIAAIMQDRLAEGWEDYSNRWHQKDLDDRWVKPTAPATTDTKIAAASM